MPSPSDLAASLTHLRTTALISATTSAMLFDPRDRQRMLDALRLDDTMINAVHLGRRLSTGSYTFTWSTEVPRHQPASGILDALRPWGGVVALAAGDAMKQSGLPTTPLSEFVRHVRNAVAHDWHFDIRHMNGPAEFDGLTIDRTLHGEPLMDHLYVGDIFALLDAVIDRLTEA